MSNLLKRGTTVSSDERVIDYNDLVKSKLKHIIEIQNNKDNVDADGFVNGLKADVVEQLLTGSEDDMNEEAATDASYEAQAASIIENASNETYPIVRPLYYYYNVKNKEQVSPLIQFILSSDGQDIIKKSGYIPVK